MVQSLIVRLLGLICLSSTLIVQPDWALCKVWHQLVDKSNRLAEKEAVLYVTRTKGGQWN